jgi:hypothetical protein
MLYKFKSKADGDVIMLGPNGDELLRVLGREPAAKGIIEPDAMAAAIACIDRALHDEAAPGPAADDEDDAREQRRVALRQRLWPMRQMLERSLAARVPIVWGV